MKKVIILGLTNVARILRYEMQKDAGIYTESYCLTSDYMKINRLDLMTDLLCHLNI